MLLYFILSLAASIQALKPLLPGSCDFESNTCDYTSDGDFASWSLHKDGRFVTLDADLFNNKSEKVTEEKDGGPVKGTTGILLSPVLEQDEWSCLRLVYQISVSGSLAVLQRTEGESLDRPLWSSQAPSDSWVITSMDLQNISAAYRIVVEGNPGTEPGSSVAVFEIHIRPGYCLECDFEESHLCGYSNQWNANVNWYVGGGGGQLVHNNMPDDNTYRNKTGHYMYVDSVYAKTFKEVAKLVSPMAAVPMSGCLSFQYQRTEERGNMFSVYTRDPLRQYQELWRAGPESSSDWNAEAGEWIPVQVDLKAPYSVQVVFEVAFNSPRGGRVALDDISFSPEFCSKDTEPTFDPSIANCDFESGLCQYRLDQPGASSWKRVSVKPNIFRSGDHTTGTGSYLMTQSRLNSRSSYVSRLEGPTLPGNMKYCLRFFFSLRGFNHLEQALNVYLQHGASHETIWALGEKSRGIWIASDVTFQTAQPSKLVFVSTCRSLWDCGSVAVDDISVGLGDCDLTTASLSRLPGHCDFEVDLCGYTQDKHGDDGDWERRRGPTPTSYTGPRGDHTSGLGHYLHMEASPLLPGQSVRLRSRLLRGSWGPQCLHFFYNMYGSGTGQLSVRLDREGGGALLWQRSGEQSAAWLRASVEYQSSSQHQIVFEATRGSSVRSDIAIDDIILEAGPCQATEVQTSQESSNDIE